MIIVYLSNFFNHHQKPLADALYEKTGHQYMFVETMAMPESFKKTGYTEYQEPYVYRYNADTKAFIDNEILNADVLMYDSDMFDFVKPRLVTEKLSIDVGERWFKKGLTNLFSPRLIKSQWFYHTKMCRENKFKLCQSSYGSHDMKVLHSYKGKCYKWGYFTKVESLDISTFQNPRNGCQISLMWCARMIDWKHPELPIKLAANLKSAGYNFVLDMFGGGELKQKMVELAEKLNVTSFVNFCGNVSNELVLKEMRQHDIFLFTSDRNEGWGAVANEAMANGCVLVGSDEIGAVPYLVKNGVNGSIFKSNNLDSLSGAVKSLIDNPEKRQAMAVKAYETMSTTWSPAQAAKNLLEFIQALHAGRETPIEEGPCSIAL